MQRRASDVGRAIAAVALALAVCGCSTPEQRHARAMRKGTEFYAAGNYEKAGVEFRNALQLVPSDGEARYQFGRVSEKLGKLREAGQLYQAAIDINPQDDRARADFARLCVFGAAPQRAVELLAPALARHPDDAGMLTTRAAARAQLKDAAGAFEDGEHALLLEPKNELAIAVVAGLHAAAGRSDEARALLDRGIRDLPASTDLRRALAQLYLGAHDAERAEAVLRDLVRLAPASVPDRILLANLLASTGQVDIAEQELRGAIKAAPDNRDLKLALVSFLAQRRQRSVAEQELKSLAAAEHDGDEWNFVLVSLYAQSGDNAAAEALLRRIIERNAYKPAGLKARDELAALRSQVNDRTGAEALVGEVLAHNPHDVDALVMRGNLLLAKQDAPGAIADLHAVLRDEPNSVSVLRALARAHVLNNEPVLAEESLRRAVDANPKDIGARVDLAMLLLQTGKAGPAKDLLQRLASEAPTDVAVQDALFKASVASNDVATARLAAEAAIAAQPKASAGYLYRGIVEETERRPERALEDYRQAMSRRPDALEPLQALTLLLVKMHRDPEAIKALDAATAANPKWTEPRVLKAQILLAQRRFADATAVLTAAKAIAPNSTAVRQSLAATAQASGDKDGAVRILEESVAVVDQPNEIRAALAQLYEQSGRNDDAIKQYDAILKDNPKSALAANNLAMLLVTVRSDPASVARAADLTKAFADAQDANLVDTYGWVKLKAGDPGAAVAALETARSKAPTLPVIGYHLGMAQLAAGQTSLGRETLQRTLAAGVPFTEAADAKAALARVASAK